MRSVYFSFHYEDVWKANVVRNSGVVFGSKSAGFADRSLWEEAKVKSRARLEKLIEDGLDGTSVTAVLIGRETAQRAWVKHEIKRSLARGNALVGIHIHKIPDRNGRTTRRGAIPSLLKRQSAPIADWSGAHDLGQLVERAWQDRNDPSFLQQFLKWLSS